MTPDAGSPYSEFTVRQPIHYKYNTIQYSILSNTLSGGFDLEWTKILYQVERKNIYT
jgi:hypothetical protein